MFGGSTRKYVVVMNSSINSSSKLDKQKGKLEFVDVGFHPKELTDIRLYLNTLSRRTGCIQSLGRWQVGLTMCKI